jgi:hypothetical protein
MFSCRKMFALQKNVCGSGRYWRKPKMFAQTKNVCANQNVCASEECLRKPNKFAPQENVPATPLVDAVPPSKEGSAYNLAWQSPTLTGFFSVLTGTSPPLKVLLLPHSVAKYWTSSLAWLIWGNTTVLSRPVCTGEMFAKPQMFAQTFLAQKRRSLIIHISAARPRIKKTVKAKDAQLIGLCADKPLSTSNSSP